MSEAVVVEPSSLHPATIRITGYKHAAVAVIAASIATGATIHIKNVPAVEDAAVMSEIINALGGDARREDGSLKVDAAALGDYRVPPGLSAQIHGALYFLPGLLGRFGRVEIGACGGCRISDAAAGGRRPVGHMISVLERFGAALEVEGDTLVGRAEGLRSCSIDIFAYSDRRDVLTGPLVSGATKTAILAAAAVGRGVTRILHPYPKPDVTELLRLLTLIGYDVRHDGDAIEIERGAAPRAAEISLVSDISEIITWIAVGIFHNIPLELINISVAEVKRGLRPELELLGAMGIAVDFGEHSLRIAPVDEIRAVDIEVTSVGIYSDHQPFFALLLLGANAPASIREQVWKDRFQYATELRKLGCSFVVDGNRLFIRPGPPSAGGQTLLAADVRGAAALVIAAIRATAPTRVEGVEHLRRGYSDFFGNLSALGAQVTAA